MSFNNNNQIANFEDGNNSWFLMKLSTIKKWVYMSVLWIISWAGISLWVNKYFYSLVKEDNNIINVVWKQRMLTQRIAKAILLEERKEFLWEKIDKENIMYTQYIDYFSRNLAALLDWWYVVSDIEQEKIIEISPVENESIRKKLLDIKNKWILIYPELLLGAPSIKESYINELNISFLKDIDNVIIEFIEEREKLKEIRRRIDVIIMVLTGIFLWLVARFFLFDVLKRVEVDQEQKDELFKNIQKLNIELEKKFLEAEKAKEARTVFLAHTIHEVRTPMTPIIINAENLLSDSEKMTQEEIRDSADVVLSSTNHISYILNNFLDFSKLEKWEVVLEEAKFDIYDLVSDIRKQFSDMTREKWLEFDIEIDSKNGNFIVEGDSFRIKQVLINLIWNAIKFTETWKITLSVLYINEKLVIKVIDTWIGMNKDALNNLFVEFRQADNSMERKYGGTWLGMAITKKIIETMWWKIFVQSDEGKWTSFEIFIPVKDCKDCNKEKKTKEKQKKSNVVIQNIIDKYRGIERMNVSDLKLLIVDDKLMLRMLIKNIFTKKWFIDSNIELAEDWLDWFNKAMAWDFDIIIMDYHMPILNWEDATKKIKKENKDVIVILSSAWWKEAQNIDLWLFEWMIDKPLSNDSVYEFVNIFSEKTGVKVEFE